MKGKYGASMHLVKMHKCKHKWKRWKVIKTNKKKEERFCSLCNKREIRVNAKYEPPIKTPALTYRERAKQQGLMREQMFGERMQERNNIINQAKFN